MLELSRDLLSFAIRLNPEAFITLNDASERSKVTPPYHVMKVLSDSIKINWRFRSKVT